VQRGGTGIGLSIPDPKAGSGREVNTTPWPLYSQETDPKPIVMVAGWALGLAWIPHGGLNPGPSSPQSGAIPYMLPQWPNYCQHSSHL